VFGRREWLAMVLWFRHAGSEARQDERQMNVTTAPQSFLSIEAHFVSKSIAINFVQYASQEALYRVGQQQR